MITHKFMLGPLNYFLGRFLCTWYVVGETLEYWILTISNKGFVHVRRANVDDVAKEFLKGAEAAAFEFAYRGVPAVFNADTFQVWYGDVIVFDPPETPLALPAEGVFKDVQYPFDISYTENGVRVGIEFQDRCPVWVHFSYSEYSQLVSNPLLQGNKE
eukprot:m.183887 g.183887  ORF g.183887 m.183887 type:complete len:158 (+) comp15550_c0_seq12:1565-2038(+)